MGKMKELTVKVLRTYSDWVSKKTIAYSFYESPVYWIDRINNRFLVYDPGYEPDSHERDGRERRRIEGFRWVSFTETVQIDLTQEVFSMRKKERAAVLLSADSEEANDGKTN